MLDLRKLLELWGFTSHPFETYTAENEPRLPDYFVAPPYLDDMIGTASSMSPAIVFGARGIGKSAIRIYIESLCTKQDSENAIGGRAIAITYDDFSHVLEKGLEHISIDKHLEVILNKIVGAALLTIASTLLNKPSTEEEIKNAFPLLDIQALGQLIQKYFTPLNELQRERTLRGVYNYFRGETLSIYDRANWFQQLWSTLRVPIMDITNIIQAVRGKELLKPIDMPSSLKTTVRDTEELINDLQAVAALTNQLGIDGWYILIDKIDEDEHTDSDAVKSAKLILPLIKNLRILEIPRIGLKFFLWNQLRPTLVEEKVRLDKIRNWEMGWTKQELSTMIDRRLAAYSNGKIDNLLFITEENASNIYDLVIGYAMDSPREIMHILDEIFREHARHSTEETGILISRSSIDRGLDNYCLRRVKDLYPNEIVRTISRLPSVKFTSNHVQTVLKISRQAASIRISKWIDDGYIERTEDTRSDKDPSKLIYQYRIREKRLERLVQRGLNQDNTG